MANTERKGRLIQSLQRFLGVPELAVTAPYYVHERRDRHGNIAQETFAVGADPVVICEFPHGIDTRRRIILEPDGSLSGQVVSRGMLRGEPKLIRDGKVSRRFLDGLGFGTESVRPVPEHQ